MIKAPLFTSKGVSKGTFELPENVFGKPVSPVLLAQAVKIYLGNQRQAGATTKDRGDVEYSKIKIYRQKGTGKARHGARSAPIFVGGGVAHGPNGEQNYKGRLSKSMRARALVGALTAQAEAKAINVIEDVASITPKAKVWRGLLKSLDVLDAKVLLILESPLAKVLTGVGNLANVSVTQAKRLSVYEILRYPKILITTQAIGILNEQYAKKETKKI